MSTPITAPEIISWFRNKAEEFNSIADTLERTFAVASAFSPQSKPKPALTKQAVHERLSEKAARVNNLAEEFGVSERDITAFILDESNGLQMGERGWVRIRQNTQPELVTPGASGPEDDDEI